MRSKLQKPKIRLYASGGMVVLMLGIASMAWACTAHVSILTLSQGGRSVANTGDGGGGGYCGGTNTFNSFTTANAWTLRWDYDNGLCNPVDQVNTGIATVRRYTGTVSGCHTGGATIGTFSMTGTNGHGSGGITFANGGLQAGDTAICVERNSLQNMDIPLANVI